MSFFDLRPNDKVKLTHGRSAVVTDVPEADRGGLYVGQYLNSETWVVFAEFEVVSRIEA